MARYFMQGTPLAGLERYMMSPPACGFLSTVSSTSPPVRRRIGNRSYQDLAAECTQNWGSRALRARVKALAQAQPTTPQFHPLDFSHSLRLTALRRQAEQDHATPGNTWLAAVCLLTATPALWQRGIQGVCGTRIDFRRIQTMDLVRRDLLLCRAALGLYTGARRISEVELANPETADDATLLLILDGMLTARYGPDFLARGETP